MVFYSWLYIYGGMIIYKTTNLINGKIYVGKDTKNNPDYFGSGNLLKRALKKYGRASFRKQIVEECTNDSIDKREIYWIKKLDATNPDIGYNRASGGNGGNTYKHFSTKKRNALIQSFLSSGLQYGKSKQGRLQRSMTAKKLWKSASHRRKMSEHMRNRKITWSDKISTSIKHHWKTRSRNVSKSTRNKLSKAARGKELVKVNETTKCKIISLYKTYGPNTIRRLLFNSKIDISLFVIRRILKNANVYVPYRKGKRI